MGGTCAAILDGNSWYGTCVGVATDEVLIADGVVKLIGIIPSLLVENGMVKTGVTPSLVGMVTAGVTPSLVGTVTVFSDRSPIL